VRGAAAALARLAAVAGEVLAVVVEGLQLIDELLAQVDSTLLALVHLVLVVGVALGTRMRGARRLEVLEGVPERLLHQDTGMAASGALGALLGEGADLDVARVVYCCQHANRLRGQAKLTDEVGVDVQDTSVADVHGRGAGLAGREHRHGGGVACCLRGACGCIDGKRLLAANKCVWCVDDARRM
jgi:hypothetical protein